MMELTLTGANIFSTTISPTSASNRSSKNLMATKKPPSSLTANVGSVDETTIISNSTTMDPKQKVHSQDEKEAVAPSNSSTATVDNICTAAVCTTIHDGRNTADQEGGILSTVEHVSEIMESLFFHVKFGSFEAFRRVMISFTSSSLSSSFPSHNNSNGFYDPDGHTLAHWATKRSPDLRFMDLLIRTEFPIHFPSLDTVGMYPIHWAATEGSIPMVSLLLDYSHSHTHSSVLHCSTCSNSSNKNMMSVCNNNTNNNNNHAKVEYDAKSPLFDHTSTDPHDINVIVPNPSNIGQDEEDESPTIATAALVHTTTTSCSNTLPLSEFFENDEMCTIQPKLSKLGLSSRSTSSTTSTTLIPNAVNAVLSITAINTKGTTSPKINNSMSYHCSEDDPMINARDASGCTPLLVASQYGHVNLAAFLIKRGANYLAVDKNKDSALHWAAYKGDISIIGLLCHILTSTTTSSGSSSSSTVARRDSITNFLSLLDAPDTFGQTPIHLAALRGNTDALEYLLEEIEANSTSPIGSSNNNGISKKIIYSNAISSCPRPLRLCFALLCNKVRSRGRQDVYLPLSTVLSEDSATSTCYHQYYSPKTLLEMKDNDGRTPLDLAIKYKRSDAEMVLNEWYERYNIRSVSAFQRFCCFLAHDGIRLFCSIDSWRTWAGLTTNNHSNNHCNSTRGGDASSIGQRRMKWPFALVIASMTLACALYPLRFLPIQSKVAIVMGGSFDAFMHMFTLTSLTLGWVTFLLTWKTNPGGIKPINHMKNEMHRFTSGTSSSGNRRYGKESMPLDYMLQSLAFKLSNRYDEALEQLAHSSTSDGTLLSSCSTRNVNDGTTIPPLCHTCRIVRPLRSKHCRIQKQCILLFDHYCPFVGATIGAYNYRYFYGFLFFISCSEFGLLATWIQYLIRSETFDILVFLSGCYLSFFIIPSVGLLVYHTDLIAKNLTTNEHQNAWKYPYLQDPTSRTYKNQFDEGFLGNVYSRFFPSESSYTLLEDQQSSLLGSGSSVDDLTNETLC